MHRRCPHVVGAASGRDRDLDLDLGLDLGLDRNLDRDFVAPAATPWSRRELLGAFAAGVAGAAFGTLGALAPVSTAWPQAPARRLDLHHHFASPAWIRKMSAAKRQGWQIFEAYTPQRSLEAMDQAGVETAFVSCTLPGVAFSDDFASEREDAIALAREMNEYGAHMVADYPGRFGLFAVLPLPDVEASLREIEYAFDTLRADGIGLLTSYGNVWLGDPSLRPVFDELDRRGAVVYSHPTDGPCCHNLLPGTGPGTVEWQTDTARSIFSLINDGGEADFPDRVTSPATRYANIRFVWSHAGGTLIGLMNRFIGRLNLANEDLARVPAPNSRMHHLRRFYYDTAQSTNPLQMQALKGLVGASQIVFGADYPYSTIEDHVVALRGCGFTAEELAAIDRRNALRILPKYDV
jgi:predicted TIM-barrel fold metal-dependent hydrolase